MSYANARDIFPDEIVEMIQNYIDGECIYIPKKEDKKLSWGERSQSKKELLDRNAMMYEDYLKGMSIQNLSEKYYLAPKTIQKIISTKKKRLNTRCAT